MFAQDMRSRECLFKRIADERALSEMRAFMGAEAEGAGEGFTAEFAVIRPSWVMGSLRFV